MKITKEDLKKILIELTELPYNKYEGNVPWDSGLISWGFGYDNDYIGYDGIEDSNCSCCGDTKHYYEIIFDDFYQILIDKNIINDV